jgi:hypothetical protein
MGATGEAQGHVYGSGMTNRSNIMYCRFSLEIYHSFYHWRDQATKSLVSSTPPNALLVLCKTFVAFSERPMALQIME